MISFRAMVGILNMSVLVSFTLHTEPRINPPEFTVTCQTQGGPAEEIQWFLNRHSLESYVNQSKVIRSTTHNSIYDNNVRVRGRFSGMYRCSISNTVSSSSVGYINIIGINPIC